MGLNPFIFIHREFSIKYFGNCYKVEQKNVCAVDDYQQMKSNEKKIK